MTERSGQPEEPSPDDTRVIADFGGRRKILDRRHLPSTPYTPERRSGTDRRSGFDRRGALTQNHSNIPEKRHNFSNEGALKEKSTPGTG
jgi:hypothetical protein